MSRLLENKNHTLYSLRKRALLLSAVISIVVLSILVMAYSKSNETQEKTLDNIQQRSDAFSMLNHIRVNLLNSYKDLNNFLLVPEKKQYKESTLASLNDAIKVSDQILSHSSVVSFNDFQTRADLSTMLRMLESEMNVLFKVRLNSSELYPALSVAGEYMRPNRIKMNNLLGVIHNEMHVDNVIQSNPEIYDKYISTRYLWNKMLSNFRIYLANRVGSFDTRLMRRQENGIETTYIEFKNNMSELTKLAKNDKLGFETTYAVIEMTVMSAKWFEGFKKIEVINNSDNWRLDAQIMKDKISPRIDMIVVELFRLETHITDSATKDFNLFAQWGQSQNRLLWLVSFIGVAFIMIIVFSLDRFIFKPITLVVSALKSEALGKVGEIIPTANSQEAYDLINAFSEMSRQVHTRQSELEHRALHDSLTSLPNRALLFDRMEHDVNTARREKQTLCLMILDLDEFKQINDTLGHTVGDKLLVEIGLRLVNTLRDVDTVARIGGDEFAILLPHTSLDEAESIAKKVLIALKEVMPLESVELYVNCSIGIASYPEHSLDANDLLRLADIAMYVAKRNKSGYENYNPAQDEHSLSKLSLINDLRDALQNNLLEVYYQPVLNVRDNKVIGVEALCRWFHEELGSISPDSFIVLAEQAGLINDLTYWVLEQSVMQLNEWHKLNDELTVAVNISVYSFKNKEFVSRIRKILENHSFPRDKLTLEITEGAMMENPLQAVEVLSELQSMQINLAVDDFGTGYSSMAYLKNLPVNELKIDKSFVIGLDTDTSNEAIVRSTIDLAHNLGLRVIAEGVETQQTWDLLSSLECDVAQGYHMGKPISSDEFSRTLSNK